MDGSNVDSSNTENAFSFSCASCSGSKTFALTSAELKCDDCQANIPRKTAIENFLRDYFAKQFEFPIDSITAATVLREVGDSLGIIEMLLRLEKKFGVAINHEDMEDLETIEDVAVYIDRTLAS